MDETPGTPDTSTMPPISSALASASPASPKPRGSGVFAAIGLGALIVVVVLGLILSRGGLTNGGIPSDWTTFHDPAGYFTLALPPGWTIDGGLQGTGTMGSSDGSYTVTDYMWTARDPATGSLGPNVSIYYHPLPTAFARQFECDDFPSQSSTFAGLPATTINDDGWILSTSAAHYQINYGFPPDGTYHTDLPTPIPAATLTAGTDLSRQVANTFRPIPATPLSC